MDGLEPNEDANDINPTLGVWRSRLVFWCGAVVIGVIAAGFAYIADYAQQFFAAVVSPHPLLPFLVCPAIFALSARLTSRYFPSTVGSGIPQAIAARVANTREERRYLLGPKVIVGKILLTALGLMGGASIGREGPTVQVGAALLYLGASFTNMSLEMKRSLILAGAAAGVAAAFNTPLAGIVFAIEEMARAFEHRNSSIILSAIVFAGAASLSILGNYSYFGNADGSYNIVRDILAIGVVGLAGGLFGGLFSRVIISGGRVFRGFCGAGGWYRPPLFAAACGLAIACIGYLTGSTTFGTGYAPANGMLHGLIPGSWTFTFGKFLATAISGFSGIPGGIFSPSLSVGAGFGASMAPLFPSTPLAGIVLLGMTAYFSGVTQSPITAFVIVLEVSGRQSQPVPLIAAAVIAAAASRLVCHTSLYHTLAKNFIFEAKAPPSFRLRKNRDRRKPAVTPESEVN
jgi:H+/Cl- antiporter ClcA